MSTPIPAVSDGRWHWYGWRYHLRPSIRWRDFLQAIHVHWAPEPVHFVDAVTGQHIEIRRGGRYTVIAVNGRDYYFDPDGHFDGTGMGCYPCARGCMAGITVGNEERPLVKMLGCDISPDART